jgi:hypothetical protein
MRLRRRPIRACRKRAFNGRSGSWSGPPSGNYAVIHLIFPPDHPGQCAMILECIIFDDQCNFKLICVLVVGVAEYISISNSILS